MERGRKIIAQQSHRDVLAVTESTAPRPRAARRHLRESSSFRKAAFRRNLRALWHRLEDSLESCIPHSRCVAAVLQFDLIGHEPYLQSCGRAVIYQAVTGARRQSY